MSMSSVCVSPQEYRSADSSGRSLPGMFRCSKDGLTVDTDHTSVSCSFGTASSIFHMQVDFAVLGR